MSDKRTLDRVVVSKVFEFEASHMLEFHEGKCKRLHGHSYKLLVSLIGDVHLIEPSDPASGMVIDFADLKTVVKPMIDEFLDHRHLNDTIDYPTAENVVLWIVAYLKPTIQDMLYEVTLWETATCSATWKKHLHG